MVGPAIGEALLSYTSLREYGECLLERERVFTGGIAGLAAIACQHLSPVDVAELMSLHAGMRDDEPDTERMPYAPTMPAGCMMEDAA